jgi:uncharacterized membrane protein
MSILFVWRLNLTLLYKVDETRSIQLLMLCLHDLKFWFSSIGEQQSYLGSKVGHVVTITYFIFIY